MYQVPFLFLSSYSSLLFLRWSGSMVDITALQLYLLSWCSATLGDRQEKSEVDLPVVLNIILAEIYGSQSVLVEICGSSVWYVSELFVKWS